MQKIRLPSILALALCLAACVMRPVDPSKNEQKGIFVYPGDVVRVLTKHGERPTFRVVTVEKEALVGKDVRIAYEDMVFVEKRTVSSPAVTGGLMGGIMYVQIINAGLGMVYGGINTAFFVVP